MANHQPTDSELVGQTLAGDREAFGCLYDRYARLVRAVVYAQTLDGPAVHDLTQDSFLRAYRKLSTLRETDRFAAWLVSIARQVARERKRSRRRERHEFVGDGVEKFLAVDGRLDAIDDQEQIDWIRARLAQLDERERLAITVFYLQDRDAQQTAELLDLSRSGMYALLSRAVARLAQQVRGPESKDKAKP